MVSRSWQLTNALLCLALLVPVLAFGQESPASRTDNELRSQVRGYLLELDSNQRARRQSAEKQLLDLGPRILSLLPPPELLPNVAVKSTVARIRVTLERRQALDSVQASQVSIPGNLVLVDWLKQVEDQTGNHIDISALPSTIRQQRINLKTTTEPFWKALDEALYESHLSYRFRADSSVLKLVPDSDPEADAAWSTSRTGPFRMAVDWVRPRKVIGNDQLQRLRTELSVAPEPRLRALFLKMAAKDFQAKGPRGQVFPAADESAQYDLPLGEGGRYVSWNLDFAAPSNIPEADLFPLKITGQAAMQIAASSEHIRFTDLVDGEGTARRRGGVTVTTQKIKSQKAADGKLSISIKVLVVYDTGGPAFESHRTWIFHNQVYLDRNDNEPIPANGGFDTDLQQNGAVGVTYRFEGLPGELKDYEFVYVAPTLIVDVPFKLELEGVRPPMKQR